MSHYLSKYPPALPGDTYLENPINTFNQYFALIVIRRWQEITGMLFQVAVESPVKFCVLISISLVGDLEVDLDIRELLFWPCVQGSFR